MNACNFSISGKAVKIDGKKVHPTCGKPAVWERQCLGAKMTYCDRHKRLMETEGKIPDGWFEIGQTQEDVDQVWKLKNYLS